MSEPQWLDDDEMAFWRLFIAATSSTMQAIESDLKTDAGIAFDDYEVLVYLSQAEGGRLRMNELSEALLHSRSRLTQRIDRMAKRGLVEREKCPDDKRGTFAVMTPAGRELIEAAAVDHVRSVREHLISNLTKAQLAQGRKILGALTAKG